MKIVSKKSFWNEHAWGMERMKEIKINVSDRRMKMSKVWVFFLGFIVFRCNMLRIMEKFNDSRTRKNVLFTEKHGKENFSTPDCLTVYLSVHPMSCFPFQLFLPLFWDFPVFFFASSFPSFFFLIWFRISSGVK